MTIGTPMRGTRSSQNFKAERIAGGAMTKTLTRDIGMTKNVTASITFGSNQLLAAASTFTAFAAGDDILVEGVNLNNGLFHVISTDGSTELTVDPPPKTEGPISATVRTP